MLSYQYRDTLPISRIRRETSSCYTISFKQKISVNPGQFFVISISGIGEKPFSPSFVNSDEWGFTFRCVGDFTNKLASLSVGDFVSVRGAYGSSFFCGKGDLLLAGGGCGSAPLHFLAQRLAVPGNRLFIVNGANDYSELLFRQELYNLACCYIETSDTDGCTAVESASELLRQRDFSYVYAAGPELMLKSLYPHVEGSCFDFLMERYMKCGFGICGSCVCATEDSAILICKDGPVLDHKQVANLTDFGLKRRDAAGRSLVLQS